VKLRRRLLLSATIGINALPGGKGSNPDLSTILRDVMRRARKIIP